MSPSSSMTTLHQECDMLYGIAKQFAVATRRYCTIVESVYLYGSVARRDANPPSDLDLLLTVSDECHMHWLNLCRSIHCSIETPPNFGYFSSVRFLAAVLSIDGLDTAVEDTFGKWDTVPLLDIYLVPYDWRKRLDELQRMSIHEDPLFMKTISKEAFAIGTSYVSTPKC